uniref:Serendipity locus protein alpha n=1 Tax=Drosophila virilis TaxID=7244 RepID=SRYA_DROVI|nr:RecName: Full=Serendipity locus protein alpha [Drosophila virilis]AAC69336.1 serendipity alpha protein [Drosophila virilis]
MDKLYLQLNLCTDIIEKGATCHTAKIAWLNEFCAAFHTFASKFKSYLIELAPKNELEGNIRIHVETIYLCFTQVITCITQLERTINIEGTLAAGAQLLATRTHFLDRIDWCLRRLQASVYQLAEEAIASTPVKLEDLSFVELLDLALDKLETYSEIVPAQSQAEQEDSDEIDQLVDHVNHLIKHALAFANVALESDKKALSAIYETVLEESGIFEKNFKTHNPNRRKLEALSLQPALYSLETYLNEALFDLIFTSMFDTEKASIKRLRNVLQSCESSGAVDGLLSDFDINVDRIQQIGIFAIAFTQDVKTKTIIRSCLASLESLDACIVPAFQLQTTSLASYHADILEHHFRQELMVFRNVIHEIIDSRALINNYLDILAESIDNAEKLYPKGYLLQVAQMGNVIYQHFQLRANNQELIADEEGKRLHQDFVAILHECQAVLEISVHVDLKRIIKRLKILYSILAKLRDVCDKLVYERAMSNNEKSMTTSTKLRQHSFANPEIGHTIANCNRTDSSDSLSHESDLISFQLTEILRIT